MITPDQGLSIASSRLFPATRTAACAPATGPGGFRSAPAYGGSSLGFGRRRIRLEDGGLAFHVRLGLLYLFFDFGRSLWLGSGRLGRRIELRAQIHHHHALLLVRLQANYGLVLRVVQEFAELLESVGRCIEAGMFLFEPLTQFFDRHAVFDIEAM